MKRLVTLLVALATFMAFGAIGAVAGEINGQGQRPMVVGTTPEGGQILHARSECAFSGLNDEFVLGLPDPDFGRTQNWGQIPKEVRDFLTFIGFNPGNACNPTKGGAPAH